MAEINLAIGQFLDCGHPLEPLWTVAVDCGHPLNQSNTQFDINKYATIVKTPLDTDRQGIPHANASQSVGVSRHHAQLPRC